MVNLHQEKKENEPRIKGINAFVLMFIIILVMSLLTYILPAGQYERVERMGEWLLIRNPFNT